MDQRGERFADVFGTSKPIIGMVHLKPLPGAPRYDSGTGMGRIIETALEDAEALVSGGIDALQVENQWDRPFQKSEDVGFETVAAIAAVIERLKSRFEIPMGVTVHLNAVRQAVAIAVATGCRWVRAFEMANAYISNAGIVEAAGPAATRYRSFLRADDDVMIFGDFHVKHGSHQILSDRSLFEQAEDVVTALGDAVIVTGLKTGRPPDKDDIADIGKAVSVPVLIGSGLSYENLDQLLPLSDGAIVGSSFKVDGVLANPVDKKRVRKFMDKAKRIRGDS
jgi:membrane complex biogenesis BtpA family protein